MARIGIEVKRNVTLGKEAVAKDNYIYLRASFKKIELDATMLDNYRQLSNTKQLIYEINKFIANVLAGTLNNLTENPNELEEVEKRLIDAHKIICGLKAVSEVRIEMTNY